jgi:hypothetical protein
MKRNIECCSDDELLNIAIDYADDNPKFDRSFIDSLSEALEQYQYLTSGQRGALENIINRFHL